MIMTDEKQSIRIDKFLWSVRIYKTRSLASDACRKGKIIINNIQVKPSRIVVKNEIVIVRKPPVSYTYRVLYPVENRVSAKMVEQFIEDMTSVEERTKLNPGHTSGTIFREKGFGRPTKRERRDLDKLNENLNDGWTVV